MKNLLNKELRLATSPLTFIFIAFAVMTLIPGYPILVGAFFVCMGIFQSFQRAREDNDMLYTVLLPVKKSDAVKAKYVLTCFIQLVAFLIMAALTVLRMAALADAEPYVNNALMSANPVFLAFVLLIFAAFNVIFLGGFFRTAYKYGKPFVCFIIAAFAVIATGEALHHIPGLAFLNVSSGDGMTVQYIILICASAVYFGLTLLSFEISKKNFEKIDI